MAERDAINELAGIAEDSAAASLRRQKPDLVVLSGDFTQVGSEEEFKLARDFVARITAETALQAAMVSGGRSYTPNHPVFRYLCDALAGPLLRPPLPRAMDAIIKQLFPQPQSTTRAAAA